MAKSDPGRDVVAKGTGRGSSLPVIIVARPTTVIRISFSAGFLSSPPLPPTVSSKRASGYGPRLQASLDDDLIVSAIELPDPSFSRMYSTICTLQGLCPFFFTARSSWRSTRINGMIFIKKFLGRGKGGMKSSLGWIRFEFLCV